MRPACTLLALVMVCASGAALAAPALTVSVTHDPVAQLVPGVAITYVIDVASSLNGTQAVVVTDSVPEGFRFVRSTCSARGAASCGGTFSPPSHTYSIGTYGSITIRLTGYFTNVGAKTHVVTASAGAETATSHDVVFLGGVQQPFSPAIEVVMCMQSLDPCVTAVDGVWDVPVHHVITVTNKSAEDYYLTGVAELLYMSSTGTDPTDMTTYFGVGWKIGGMTCASFGGASCVEVPAGTGLLAMAFAFQYPAGSPGYLPAGGGFRIELDLTAVKPSCGPPSGTARSSAHLRFGENGGPGSQVLEMPFAATGLTRCLPISPQVNVAQVQLSPANPVNWNAAEPVTYRITITNDNDAPVTNVPVMVALTRESASAFTAILESGPECVSGCSTGLQSVWTDQPSVEITSGLWGARLPVLEAHQQAVIVYTVRYRPDVCETDPRPSQVTNSALSFEPDSWASLTTTFVEAPSCMFDVKTSAISTGPLRFDQPYEYEIVYRNLSPSAVRIHYFETLVSVSSKRYSYYYSLGYDLSRNCKVTEGEVIDHPGPGKPAAQNVPAVYFGGQSTLVCRVTLIPHRPWKGSFYCQGGGQPELIVAAYMDATDRGALPGPASQSFYSEVRIGLPLCRNVIVSKTSSGHQARPGANVAYQIAVENAGDDPVEAFALSDAVPPPLVPVSVSACRPVDACIGGPALTGNTVRVSYGALQPHQPATFDLIVKAPLARGSYRNVAQGAFASGGNFYFFGDEASSLQQDEIIQVEPFADLAIALSGPPTVAVGGQYSYSIQVTNGGPDAAEQVSVTNVIPWNLTLVSAQASQGQCTGAQTLRCDLGSIANGGSATIAVTARFTATSGSITSEASVTSPDAADAVSANDEASITAQAVLSHIDGVPTLGPWLLCVLAALLALAGAVKLVN